MYYYTYFIKPGDFSSSNVKGDLWPEASLLVTGLSELCVSLPGTTYSLRAYRGSQRISHEGLVSYHVLG